MYINSKASRRSPNICVIFCRYLLSKSNAKKVRNKIFAFVRPIVVQKMLEQKSAISYTTENNLNCCAFLCMKENKKQAHHCCRNVFLIIFCTGVVVLVLFGREIRQRSIIMLSNDRETVQIPIKTTKEVVHPESSTISEKLKQYMAAIKQNHETLMY